MATNSKGNIFVYTRTGGGNATMGGSRTFTHGGARLFEFDRTGKFVREIGAGRLRISVRARGPRRSAGQHLGGGSRLQHGDQVRPGGARRCMTLGPQAGSRCVPAARRRGRRTAGAAVPHGRGVPGDNFNRPTDVAWDAAGNIFVSDGYGNSRVAKFDKNGRFLKSWGSRGRAGPVRYCRTPSPSTRRATSTSATAATSAFRSSTTTATSRRQITNVGAPWAICISPGAHQYLYSSNSNAQHFHGQRRNLQDGTRREASSASSARRASCSRNSARCKRSIAAIRTSSSSANSPTGASNASACIPSVFVSAMARTPSTPRRRALQRKRIEAKLQFLVFSALLSASSAPPR